MEDCDVHTVLRCPRGTFSPYTEGTKTNVLFFTKGRPTEEPGYTTLAQMSQRSRRRSRPLTPRHFAEFEQCYGDDPNGRSKRAEADSREDRWRSFPFEEIKAHHYKLDSFQVAS